ncbi:hypothetical protein GCM10010278_20270 [Streptomyces melanogenes]|nr:hypothetical protein GCM10010278_20270 [Streptomyces melanogenes]
MSDPVSDLAQIPAVSHIADDPNPDTTTPVRYSPALRSFSTRTRPAARVVFSSALVTVTGVKLAREAVPGNRANALFPGTPSP